MTIYDRYDCVCNPTGLNFSGPGFYSFELGARSGPGRSKNAEGL